MQKINVVQEIDDSRFSFYHGLIFTLCLLIIAADGFDTGVIGFIGSTLADDWGIDRPALAPVISAALFGMVFGALVAGPMADRLGRKIVILLSVIFLGFWTVMSAYATSLRELELYRFLTGLGLGAAMPNVATLLSEFMPHRIRSTMVNLMFFAFPGGIALGGWISGYILNYSTWHSVLLVGGIFPLVLSIFVLLLLPESLHYLMVKNQKQEKVAKILKALTKKSYPKNEVIFEIQEKFEHINSQQSALALIFSKAYRRNTFLMWTACFMSLLVFYLLTSWLTIFLQETGLTRDQALKIAPFFPLGGALGSVLIGWVMDKYHPSKTVMFSYLFAIFFLLATGFSYEWRLLFIIFILMTGILIAGAQGALPVLTATLYPAHGRATGVSWMHGIGRLGAIFGAMIGGQLLAFKLSLIVIFSLLCIPIAVTVFALLFLKGKKR